MSKFNWILDAGHGGIDKNGNYTTDPKKGKRCDYPDGFTILEGVTNRGSTKKLANILEKLDINHMLVYDEILDLSLTRRMEIVRNVVLKSKLPCIFLSIHSNAGKGTGLEFFTSPGQDYSDVVCNYFIEEAMRTWPHKKFRADKEDGDMDKEAKFYVLLPKSENGVTINTATARILFEFFFFDNREEAEYLTSEKGQTEIAEFLARVILYIENHETYTAL